MIKLHKAPYKIDKKTKKKFAHYFSIYSVNAPEPQFAKLKSGNSQEMPPFGSQLPSGMERKES